MIDWIPKTLESIMRVETKTTYGKINQRALLAVIVVTLISLLSGVTMTLTPIKDSDFSKGFSFSFNSGTPWTLAVIIMLSALSCVGFLMFCKNKGWIDTKDF